MKKVYKVGLIILIIIIVIGAAVGGYVYKTLHSGFNINKPVSIQIDSNKDYIQLQKDLVDKAKIESIEDFTRTAKWLDFDWKLRTGNYLIKPDMTVLDVVRMLRSGAQTPVKITFNNIRLKKDLCDKLASQLMLHSDSLQVKLNDEKFCDELGFNTETIVSMFIPNTYEVYWDISLDSFLKRMYNEYKKFWNDDRKAKAELIGLTPTQISTLASIVEEECTFPDEYPAVAGLYINRLKRGQLLQADPTVKFAVGDFSLRRVLNIHLEKDSPYNTYLNTGLPPGPIRIPSIKGLESVLNYAKHDYLYMCAKEDFSGYHNFAKTLSEHNRNAAKYRAELNKRGIR